MALNKARTSIWMKAFIIVLIVAFVSVFMASGLFGIFDLFQSSNTTASTSIVDPITALNQSGQARVDALKAVLASAPTSYTAQINIADAYFDWAQKLSSPQAGQSQITTAAMTAAISTWTQARAAYEAAAKLNKAFDPRAETDRSTATFYSNDATAAITLAREVVTKQPKFSQAWLNLGLFYSATKNTDLAITSFSRYIKLVPTGEAAAYAAAQIKELGGTVPATSTP